ncbi:MAG: Holliday junction resolvase RuvX [Alphaproteobacteria bacterium]|jgi:putative holliday junction resolvase|nr:Holliday junction resolvase RuvX [Alphaproteobacteria bacterium]MBU0802671.1 Holliday junction resolvase RuvX [Alphaproteobacteria bacterium]MBU0871468.1 Holliday junction resolvase RuvX [Alphaproteobacteria bacterium]MBU1400135.1 Holliday junction resolvase RuvX [Alphaproteobacteria bacterium]MBU1591255.1 Holliday junction resolvase RuvX [Alphaproteobacteria bacterium]
MPDYSSISVASEDRSRSAHVKDAIALPVIEATDLPDILAGGRTLAGLDLGDKTIGIAVSDRGLSFAHPRPVIVRKKFSIDAAALLELLKRENVGAVVIGLPVNMDGSEGPRAQASRAFVRNMARLTDLPFVFWDERLSTVAAERTLIEMDFSRKKRAGKIDSAAAAFILQGVLDRLYALGEDSTPK